MKKLYIFILIFILSFVDTHAQSLYAVGSGTISYNLPGSAGVLFDTALPDHMGQTGPIGCPLSGCLISNGATRAIYGAEFGARLS
jgi:hypothetical protein